MTYLNNVPGSMLIRAGVAVAIASGVAGACAFAISGNSGYAMLAALAAAAGTVFGLALGVQQGQASRPPMQRVAEELDQYRTFTRLLRDQGSRIVETTTEAATSIVAGLQEIDTVLERMRGLTGPDDHAGLRSCIDAADAPVLGLLGRLQFQDVTQQQIAFLSRLSLVLDDHLGQMSRQLTDHRSIDRLARFQELFDRALGDCVMDSQRDDHHAASGLAIREGAGSELEMF